MLRGDAGSNPARRSKFKTNMPLAILQLIATHGIPLAMRIYNVVTNHFESNGAPTEALWANLLKLENESNTKFVAALAK